MLKCTRRNGICWEMRKLDECDMKNSGPQDTSEKAIAILGDTMVATKDETKRRQGEQKRNIHVIWKKRNERPNVRGVSVRSRNGAPSRKGCVVNVQTTVASRK